MNPKISVIVPVYNKVSRIEACLQSVLAQDFNDYELLIINDGSTDGSDVICCKYAKNMAARIQYIDKENGGVSSARNVGIDTARGEYLCFVDADDTMKPNFLTTLINTAFGYDIITGSHGDDREWRGRDIAVYVDTVGRSMLGTSVWGKIYRKALLDDNDIRFDESVRFGEDTLFNLAVWSKVEAIRSLPYELYDYYRERRRRYELSAEDIKSKVSSLKEAYLQIGKKYDYPFSIDRDINITLSLYPLEKMMIDDMEYRQLYKYYYPDKSEKEFFDDMRCSPVLRLINESPAICHEDGFNGLYHSFKSLLVKYEMAIKNIHFTFRFHKIIGILLKHKMAMVASIITYAHVYNRK